MLTIVITFNELYWESKYTIWLPLFKNNTQNGCFY